jgi:hypothetical protein
MLKNKVDFEIISCKITLYTPAFGVAQPVWFVVN